MDTTVERLSPEHVAQLERVLPLTGKTHTVGDIEAGIANGTFQSWPGAQSIVITEIIQMPRQKVLLFFLAAGNMLEIQCLYHIILKWGQEMGCTMARIVGRKGWERSFLQDDDWRPSAVVLERRL